MSENTSLDCSVLVLNRFYMAIRVIDVRRAMTCCIGDAPKSSPSKTISTPITTLRIGVNCLSSRRSKNNRKKITSKRRPGNCRSRESSAWFSTIAFLSQRFASTARRFLLAMAIVASTVARPDR